MIGKIFISLLVSWIALTTVETAFSQDNDVSTPVNATIVRSVDVTGDGIPDNIVLNLRARNIVYPFNWSMDIYSKGKHVFTYSKDDTNIDSFFEDGPGAEDCNDYISCKKKWYFDVVGRLDIIVPRSGYDLEGILYPFGDNNLLPTTRMDLENRFGVRGTEAQNIITNISKNIRNGKAVLISFPLSPIKSSSLEMFVPELGTFVLIYQE